MRCSYYRSLGNYGFRLSRTNSNEGIGEIAFTAGRFNIDLKTFVFKIKEAYFYTTTANSSVYSTPTRCNDIHESDLGKRKRGRTATIQKERRVNGYDRDSFLYMQEEEEEEEDVLLPDKADFNASHIFILFENELDHLIHTIKTIYGKGILGEGAFFNGELDPKHGDYLNIVKSEAPTLYALINTLLSSPIGYKRNIENQEKQDRAILSIVDTFVSGRTNARSYLPFQDPQSLLRMLSGSSKLHMDMNAANIGGRSSTKMHEVAKSMPKVYERGLTFWLNTPPPEGKVYVYGIIADNYNPSQPCMMGEKNTIMIATLSFLVFRITVPKEAVEGEVDLEYQIDKAALREKINSYRRDDNRFYLNNDTIEVDRVEGFSCPHIKQFKVIEPQLGQSSSYEDLWRLLYDQMCHDTLNCEHSFVVAVTDPEPQMAINHIISQFPGRMERMKGLIPFFGLFHLVFHYARGVIIDNHNILLLLRFLVPLFRNHNDSTGINITAEAVKRLRSLLPSPRLKNESSELLAEREEERREEEGDEKEEEKEEEEVLVDVEEAVIGGDMGDIGDIEDIDAHIYGICARDGYDYRRLIDFLAFCTEHSTKWGVTDKYRKLCIFANQPKVCLMVLRILKQSIGEGIVGENSRLAASFFAIKEECDLVLETIDALFEGNSALLFQRMPAIFAKIGFDNHPRLMKAYLPLIHQLEVLKERHSDLFKHLAQNVLLMNDAFIEHHNSRMASILHQKQLSIDLIQRAAVQGAMRADINDILYKRRVGEGELKREFLCLPKPEIVYKATAIVNRLLRLFPDVDDGEDDDGNDNKPKNDKKERRRRAKKGPLKPNSFSCGYNVMVSSIDDLVDNITLDMVVTSEIRVELDRYIKRTLIEAMKGLPKEKQIQARKGTPKSAYINILAGELLARDLHLDIEGLNENIRAITGVDLVLKKVYIPKNPGKTKLRDILRENVCTGPRSTRSIHMMGTRDDIGSENDSEFEDDDDENGV